MKINNELGLVRYILVTDAIVAGYFDTDNSYIPHYGIVEAMRIYYSECVVESEFDQECPRDTEDLNLLVRVFENPEFKKVFNDALQQSDGYSFDFSNAYCAAMKIVESRVNSTKTLIGAIRNQLGVIINEFSTLMTDENIDKVTKIMEEIKSGNMDYYKIMDLFKDTDRFKEIISSDEGDEIVTDDDSKIIPIHGVDQ